MAKIYGNLTIEAWKRRQELFETGFKKCLACGAIKLLDDFYNDKSRFGGKTSKCKGCAQEYRRSPAARARERLRQCTPKWRAYQRQWCRDNPGRIKANKDRYRQSGRGRNTQRRYDENYRCQNREVKRAHYAVSDAIRDKGFPTANTQKCRGCGQQATCYHHESYEREHRLDVIPLCNLCHSLCHRRG